MIAKITKAYTRKYRRTEGNVGACRCCGRGGKQDLGTHMQAIFDRAERDGLAIGREVW